MRIRKVVALVSIILVIGLVGTAVGYYVANRNITITISNRPVHCIEDKCINPEVFAQLPKYPEDFIDVYYLIYLGQFSTLEDFSYNYPDENYYKQPEFYADSFIEQGLQYYTTKDIRFAAGAGPYPGDVVIKDINKNEKVRVITYYHASWAIPKYQLIKLIPEYPNESRTRLGKFTIKQNPDEARECINITVEPETIFLEPTYPYFYPGWTQKVVATVIPKCSGKWVVQLVPGDPDKDIELEYLKRYGLDLATIRVGGTWQIFLEVN